MTSTRQGGPGQAHRVQHLRLVDRLRPARHLLAPTGVCNYVRWTPKTDIFCSADARRSRIDAGSHPVATSWLYRNKGTGRSRRDRGLGAARYDLEGAGVHMLDFDQDGWPDLFMAKRHPAEQLYRNRGDRTFQEFGVQAGLAVQRGRPRAGGDVTDAADFDNSGSAVAGSHQFLRRDARALQPGASRGLRDRAPGPSSGRPRRRRSASAASSSTPISTACSICWS